MVTFETLNSFTHERSSKESEEPVVHDDPLEHSKMHFLKHTLNSQLWINSWLSWFGCIAVIEASFSLMERSPCDSCEHCIHDG